MGFLNRLIRGANKIDDARTDLEDAVFRDRRYDRTEDLLEHGAVVEGTITGIHFRYTNDTSEGRYRVEWRGPEPQVAGVRFPGVVSAAMRLGGSIPLRTSGDRAVLDAPLVQEVTGAPTQAGLAMRSAPEPGISDTSLNSDVLRHLAAWPRERGVVTSLEPVTVLGLSSDNVHVHVRLSDGASAVVKRAWVPPYVRAVLAPELDVPVAVDPKDRTYVVVDWCLLAGEHTGGTWRDAAPEGSVADLRRQAAAAPVQTVAMGDPFDVTPPAEGVAPIEGVTIETIALVDIASQTSRVPLAEQDEWRAREFGIPLGRWMPIRKELDARMRADWRVGSVYGEACEAATKELKRRKKKR